MGTLKSLLFCVAKTALSLAETGDLFTSCYRANDLNDMKKYDNI